MSLPIRDIELIINGEHVQASVEPRTHLADFLREDELLTGTHLGCEQGVCGACTILVDGRPVRSCLTLAIACDGSDVRTVEGFDDDPLMAQIREAFSTKHGLQCGFCTPGMLATAYDLVRRHPDSDDDQIRREFSGNLCRCTGYAGIVAAVREVLDAGPSVATVATIKRDTTSRMRTFQNTPITTDTARTEATKFKVDDIDVSNGVTLERQLSIPAPRDAVWEVISDLPSVAACIPGAVLDAPPDKSGAFSGRLVVSIGPMKASFTGQGIAKMNNAGRSGRLLGRGQDGLSRSSVKAELSFDLAEATPESSILTLDMTYDLLGPLAQFGRKALVEEIADRLLADIVSTIAARASGNVMETPTSASLRGIPFIMAVIRGLFSRRSN